MRRAIKASVAVLVSVCGLVVAAPSALAVPSLVSASSSCTPSGGTVPAGSPLSCTLQVTNNDTVSHTVLIGFAHYERGALVDGGNYSVALKPGATYTDNLNTMFGGGRRHGASFIASVGLSSYGDVYYMRDAYTVMTGPAGTPTAGPNGDSCVPTGGTVLPNSALNCSLSTTNNGSSRTRYYIGFAHYEFGAIEDGGFYSIQLTPGATYGTSVATTFDGGKGHGASFVASSGFDSTKVFKDRFSYTVAPG